MAGLLREPVWREVPWPVLPAELQGKKLYASWEWRDGTAHRVDGAASSSSASRDQAGSGSKGFSFGKAIQGIKAEDGAAHSARGDGKFDGGAVVQQRCVHGNVHCQPRSSFTR
jgi:hypothetical protein